MTDCSLNEQFEDLFQKTFQEQNQMSKYSNNQEMKQNNNNNNMAVKSTDFFRIITLLRKRKIHLKSYTTSRTKLRNYLWNISHTGITKEDFYKGNFLFDIYILLTKTLNSFSLDRKLSDENKHKMIYMLWKECIQGNFYEFICKEEHFLHIDGKKCFVPYCLEIYQWKWKKSITS